MKWDDIRAKILEVVTACVRVDTVWRDREQQFVRPIDLASPVRDRDVTCKLHVINTNTLGRDDFRSAFNEDTELVDNTQTGIRTFVVSCLVESFDQADTRFCLEYTERIRSCMQRPQVLAMFRTVELTCVGVSVSRDVSYPQDERQVSAANVDLSFSYANNESDGPGLESDGWIETVEGHRTDPEVPAEIDYELEGDVE